MIYQVFFGLNERNGRRCYAKEELMGRARKLENDFLSYEIVAYAVSRIALGDACSTVSHSSNLDRPCDSMDVLLAKSKLSKRNGRRCYAKATEELMGRARKLENDFLRIALGDACSTISQSSNLDRPCDSMDVLLAKSKLSERNGRRCYAKATKELMGRARKLENDFLSWPYSSALFLMAG
ncbi:UNVERIFIED_CONTAM: hypothetical protein Sradi_4401200 [Sesamum radiatum]|uniref:Uncharacterized protein n=1 Tax=Sesamum radiatum TaxID=300843 RepID=A0AAW2NSZ7_SESRA